MFLIAILATAGMILIAKCALEVPGSFEEIGLHANGKKCWLIILICVAASQFCFATSYAVFIAKYSIQSVLEFTDFFRNFNEAKNLNESWKVCTRGDIVNYSLDYYKLYALALPLLLVPLALFRKMDWLGRFSILGCAAIVCALGIVCSLFGDTFSMPKVDVKFDNFAVFLGGGLFAFEGIGLVVPILRSMKTPSKFPFVCYISMAITGIVYIAFGTFGALLNPNLGVGKMILSAIEPGTKTNFVYGIYIIVLTMSWPLAMQPCTAIMQKLIFPQNSGRNSKKEKWLNNALRTGIALASSIVAVTAYSKFGSFVNYLGIVLCVPLSFIIPPYLYLRVFPNQGSLSKKLNIAFIIVGCILLPLATGSQIYADIVAGGSECKDFKDSVLQEMIKLNQIK